LPQPPHVNKAATHRRGTFDEFSAILVTRFLNITDGIKTMQKNAKAKSQRTRANKRKAKRKAWHKRQRKRANG
jgi:hypothetical protein